MVGIYKCLRNLKLTLIRRGTAARALAACHIDKTALYKLSAEQIKSTQATYDKYVIGNTKLGKQRSKYVSVEKGGTSCINILKQAISIRTSYLYEALTQNNLAADVFREALSLIEINKESIPRMSNWELQALVKIMNKINLHFWASFYLPQLS